MSIPTIALSQPNALDEILLTTTRQAVYDEPGFTYDDPRMTWDGLVDNIALSEYLLSSPVTLNQNQLSNPVALSENELSQPDDLTTINLT